MQNWTFYFNKTKTNKNKIQIYTYAIESGIQSGTCIAEEFVVIFVLGKLLYTQL